MVRDDAVNAKIEQPGDINYSDDELLYYAYFSYWLAMRSYPSGTPPPA